MAYDRYAAALYGYCHWMLHDSAEAAGALTDTFVVAAATLSNLAEPAKLRPWLFALARNECRRRIRPTSVAFDEETAAVSELVDVVPAPSDATVQFAAVGGSVDVVRAPSDATVQFAAVGEPPDATREPSYLISVSTDATMPFRVISQPAHGLAHLGGGREEAELRSLVHSILAGLKPREREVIELSFRHNLYDNDLAIALGVSWSRAHALATRTRGQLEEALSVLHIALTRRAACPVLGELLADWDGQLTEETRELVSWHIKECQTCVHHGWGALRPAAFTRLLPSAPLPQDLREQVLSRCTSAAHDAVAYRRRVVRRAQSIWFARFPQAIKQVSWANIRAHPGTAVAARGLRRRLAKMPAFVNFAVGGALIALLGALLLEVLVRAGTGPLVAQAVQLVVTLALNFAYNYKITWRHRAGAGLARQVAWFLATRGATQGASWFAFAGLTALGLHYQLANGACLAGAMVINFVTSDKLVFRDSRRSRRKLPAGPHVRSRVRALAAVCVLAGVAGAWYLLRLPVLPTVMLAVAGFNLLVSGLEVRWRLYGWRTPDAAAQMGWPEPVAPGAEVMTFSLIVPVRDEASVIGGTLRRLLKQAHPNCQIVVSLCDDDQPSVAAVRDVTEGNPDASRITTVVGRYEKPSKPQQLNRALGSCTGQVVGVVDAEDDVAEDLLAHVEALFRESGADVVQGGVQLMNLGNGLGKWFQVHNVLEYFFWFTSRMAYQASAGFVPLGGNTVFIRRDLLEAAGGWPLSLTEDCALGVVLATRFGAKVVPAYSAELATREEAPPSVFSKKLGSLFWQRDRWVRGFIAEFMAGRWLQMPGRRQRVLAGYILATPFLQAISFALVPLAVITAFAVKAPIGLTMLMFAPFVPIALTVLTQLMGLHGFCRMYHQRASIWHYASLLFLTPLYQVLLAAAAAVAAYKYATGDTSWYKTGRAAEHRREAITPAIATEGAAT